MNAKAKGTRGQLKGKNASGSANIAVPEDHNPTLAELGAWDIIGIGSTDVVLVQVKTRDWPGSTEMETLHDFPTPANCRKLVHRCRSRHRIPDVKILT